MFLRILKHLLPDARAWRLTIEKLLRRFFESLTSTFSDVKNYVDLIFLDIRPETTRQVDEWEAHFGLRAGTLTEQERRDRLSLNWRALGGQSPGYFQTFLQDNGFDVYVHEWWEPGSEPVVGVKTCATPRDPCALVESVPVVWSIRCGEVKAACGEPDALCDNEEIAPPPAEVGYLLVNKTFVNNAVPGEIFTLCGEPEVICGEPEALCGNILGTFETVPVEYTCPPEVAKHAYFCYIGGETFPNFAEIPIGRKEEFENLCLKVCPEQLWMVLLIRYV